MNQNYKLRLAVLCLAGILLTCLSGKAQIVAGIRANGKILVHGDTINVCKGSSILYQSVAQGSLNIFWRFKGATPDTARGIGPFTITYNKDGIDTTFQKVAAGVFGDSMFIIVKVSSVKPVAGFTFSPDNVCGNENVLFKNTSNTGKPHKYDWSFDDGTVNSAENPSHQFLSAVGLPGTQAFTVSL
ncbi:MAG: PKD domain-containing protein, partial [Chitinophagaceae bacterium]